LRRALTEELELAGPDLDEALRASHRRLPDRRAEEARDCGSGGTADGRGGHSVANNSPTLSVWAVAAKVVERYWPTTSAFSRG
jgi:hypothetical protein